MKVSTPGPSRLYERVTPFTSALYFEENMHYRQVRVKKYTLRHAQGTQLYDGIKMVYIHDGSGILTVNGVSQPVAAGDLCWFFPFHVHALRPDERGGMLECTEIQYSLGLLMHFNIDLSYMNNLAVLEQGPTCVSLVEEARVSAEMTLARMLQEQTEKCHAYDILLLSGVLNLVTLFERASIDAIEQGITASRSPAWTALEYLQVHFNRNLDAVGVGAVIGLTPAQLNRSLRLMTGMNFQKNLASARVRNACAMMQFEGLTFPYIANYVGFSTTAAFYRSFKAIKGVTPGQYREELGEKEPAPVRHIPDTARVLLIYINEHYREDISADSAAKDLYLSAASVNEALDKAFHMSFTKMLSTVRLWVAAGLLSEEKLTVDDVAYAAGFGSRRTFSRCFRERYGCAPSDYAGHKKPWTDA